MWLKGLEAVSFGPLCLGMLQGDLEHGSVRAQALVFQATIGA